MTVSDRDEAEAIVKDLKQQLPLSPAIKGSHSRSGLPAGLIVHEPSLHRDSGGRLGVDRLKADPGGLNRNSGGRQRTGGTSSGLSRGNAASSS